MCVEEGLGEEDVVAERGEVGAVGGVVGGVEVEEVGEGVCLAGEVSGW